MRRGGRIGRRVMWLVAIAVLVSVALAAGLFIWVQSANAVKTRYANIEATAYVFASAVADEVLDDDRQAMFEVLRAVTRVPDISYVAVTDPQGREIAAMGSAVLLQDGLAEGAPGATSLFTATAFPVAVDIVHAGQPIARLVVVASISDLRTAAAWAMFYTLLSALAASGFGMLVSLRLQRRITMPILSLTAAMQGVKETKNFSASVARISDDETGVLVDTFNDMLSEINRRDVALADHRRKSRSNSRSAYPRA